MKKLSRAEAMSAGLKRYFTGKPCKRGHVSERLVSTKTCLECKNERERSRPKRVFSEDQLERRRQRSRDNYRRDPERHKGYVKSYLERGNNKIVASKKRMEKVAKRRREDPIFAARHRISCLIRQCLKYHGSKKQGPTSQILGCTTEFFASHIERQFTDGMSWHNMGEWHIDHIIPVSLAEDEDHLLALNHYTNLRPLWASENLRKSNKMEYLI